MLITLPLLSSCRHPNANLGLGKQTLPVPEENKDGSRQYIVREGESSQAVYSPDGDKILYVSQKRPNHSQAQIYELNLKTGEERRITFQSGNTAQPQYNPRDSSILYASSTDELKENPSFLPPSEQTASLPKPYQDPTELYEHSLRNYEIIRLTNHTGFDGEARFLPERNKLTFTRSEGGHTRVLVLSLGSSAVHEIKNLGVNPTQYVTSPDGKNHAWVEWDKTFAVARLRVQKGKAKAVELASENIVRKTDLAFSPDGKWLLWSQQSVKGFDLWAADVETLCPRLLREGGSLQLRYPVISPDLRWVLFSEESNDRSRIARFGFSPPQGTCPPAS